MKKLRLLPEVWEDLNEAAAWYDRKGGRALGDRLIAAFDAQLDGISQLEVAYRKVFKDFGRVFVKPFPYAIYFRTHKDFIVVVLLWHTARDPASLAGTLRERNPIKL